MTISFNTISANILTPGQYVEFDNSKAVQGLPAVPHKALLIAPRLSTGSLAALTPSRVRSAAEGEAFLGRGSFGAAMVAAFKAANPYTDLFVIGVSENAAGTAASGTLVVTGPATAAGTYNLYIGGKRVSVAVANGDSATVIAAAINAAINADTSLPVTSTVTTATVTIAARYKGVIGNDIDLRSNYNYGDATPAGVGVAITAMSGGATNPDITAATAALGDSQYHTIVSAFNDAGNMVVIETLLSTRWGGMVMKEGHCFVAAGGTYSAITTLGAARNSAFDSIMGLQKSPTTPWEVASILAAIDADQSSTPANVNRPRQTLELVGMLPPAETDRYTRAERNIHLQNGISTFYVDEGGVCRIERLVTTYKTSNSVPDTSYQDVEIMRLLAYLRYSLRVRIALKYPRHKLASDGTKIPPGQPIATPKTIRDEIIVLGMDWVEVGLIENLDQFKKELLVERDSTDVNRINAIVPPDCINGFRVFAASVQFRL